MMQAPYIRMAVIIQAKSNDSEALVAAIDSVRKQTRIPWFVRILDYNGLADSNPEVRMAISNLKLFCPDVQAVSFKYTDVDPYRITCEGLLYTKVWDVLVTMESDIVLRMDALSMLTLPLYNRGTLWSYGTLDHIEPTDHWWNRLKATRKISYRLHACRRSVISEFLA